MPRSTPTCTAATRRAPSSAADRARRWDTAVRLLRRQRSVHFEFELVANALNRRFVDYEITAVLPDQDYYDDLTEFLYNLYTPLRDRVLDLYRAMGGISFSLTVNQHYHRLNNPAETQATALHSEYYDVLSHNDVELAIRAALYEIWRQHDEYNEGASNWVQDYTGTAMPARQRPADGARHPGRRPPGPHAVRAAGGRRRARVPAAARAGSS